MFAYDHTYIPNGFLRNGESEEHKYSHPSPKPFRDWRHMIEELHPESLFDPFAGSCCIGEVGEALGIVWDACEINEAYIDDIKYRVESGKRKRANRRMGLW